MANRRSPVKPVTPANKAMSRKHLRESVAFNESHAAEHKKAAAQDRKKLAQLRKGGRASG